ncbi:MAG: SPOR domain-containing protein [Erythrobacter sp.]
MKLPDRTAIALAVFGVAMTFGSGSTQAREQVRTTGENTASNGPAADYPVVIGAPFEVDGVTYTPLDTMNYDRVGYAMAEANESPGVTGAHRTLPLPSYIEVTALDTGKTILVRLERRGPMSNDHLLSLSPLAMNQLAVSDGAPVRIRRVNPPEEHRSKLRAGEEAPLRMDTPEGLLVVLRKRLPEAGSASLSDPRQEQVSGLEPSESGIVSIDPTPESMSVAEEQLETPAIVPVVEHSPEPASVPNPPPFAAEGKFVVQVGAFSIRSNAEKLAAKLGGFLVESGRLTIVRTGPYASRGQAADALAKLRAQGYSDAQIRTLD